NQYSFNYREDYNRRLSLGVKLSLLSGITYNSLNVEQSSLFINRETDEFDLTLKGNYKSNIISKDLNSGIINPTFRDPGASISLGGSYKFRGDWFLMGNLKDIGFIKWNKKSYNYNFDQDINVSDAANGSSDEIINVELGKMLTRFSENASYSTMINGKAEALLSRNYGNYKPNFIISKNLFYPGGHVALVNNYKVRNFVFTATPDYNLDGYLQLGAQAMIKSPNVELFIGTDNLLKTVQASRNLNQNIFTSTKGFSAASAYFGFAFKFGPPMEHSTNANFIPGMNKDLQGGGFFNRLFKKGN
ncbi:MAG: hypothetical protein H7096_07825, partial [Flavobacterium sp.]|nr:hypothetical protein [Pedobacter sp.]